MIGVFLGDLTGNIGSTIWQMRQLYAYAANVKIHPMYLEFKWCSKLKCSLIERRTTVQTVRFTGMTTQPFHVFLGAAITHVLHSLAF